MDIIELAVVVAIALLIFVIFFKVLKFAIRTALVGAIFVFGMYLAFKILGWEFPFMN